MNNTNLVLLPRILNASQATWILFQKKKLAKNLTSFLTAIQRGHIHQPLEFLENEIPPPTKLHLYE